MNKKNARQARHHEYARAPVKSPDLAVSARKDCTSKTETIIFSKLPLELLTIIADMLPTASAATFALSCWAAGAALGLEDDDKQIHLFFTSLERDPASAEYRLRHLPHDPWAAA